MPGITITFDEQTNQHINSIYSSINKNLGEDIIKIDENLRPHVSIMRTEIDDEETPKIKEAMDKLAQKYQGYLTRAEGLSIFTKGDRIIVFFSIAYDENMQKIHRDIWEMLGDKIKIKDARLYGLKAFVPHITIPVCTMDTDKIKLVILELLDTQKYGLRFPIMVDSISYLQAKLKDSRILATSKFQQPNAPTPE